MGALRYVKKIEILNFEAKKSRCRKTYFIIRSTIFLPVLNLLKIVHTEKIGFPCCVDSSDLRPFLLYNRELLPVITVEYESLFWVLQRKLLTQTKDE
jgi:hypothetical protein